MRKENNKKKLVPLFKTKLPEKIYIIPDQGEKEQHLAPEKVAAIMGQHRSLEQSIWGEDIWIKIEEEKFYHNQMKQGKADPEVETYFKNLSQIYDYFVLCKKDDCGFGANARKTIEANFLLALYLGKLDCYKADAEGNIIPEKNLDLIDDAYVCNLPVTQKQKAIGIIPYISGKDYLNHASIFLCAPDQEQLADSFLTTSEIEQIQPANLTPVYFYHFNLNFMGLKTTDRITEGTPLVWDYSDDEYFESLEEKFYLFTKQGDFFSKSNALLYLHKAQKVKDLKEWIKKAVNTQQKDPEIMHKIAHLLLTSHHRILKELSKVEMAVLQQVKLQFYSWFLEMLKRYHNGTNDKFKYFLFEDECALYSLVPHLKLEQDYYFATQNPSKNKVGFFDSPATNSQASLEISVKHRNSLEKLDQEAEELFNQVVTKKTNPNVEKTLKKELDGILNTLNIYWDTRAGTSKEAANEEIEISIKSAWYIGLAFYEQQYISKALQYLTECHKLLEKLPPISSERLQKSPYLNQQYVLARIFECEVFNANAAIVENRKIEDQNLQMQQLETHLSEFQKLAKEAWQYWDKFSDMGLDSLCYLCFHLACFELKNLDEKYSYLEKCKVLTGTILKAERLKALQPDADKIKNSILEQFGLIGLVHSYSVNGPNPLTQAKNPTELRLKSLEACYEMMVEYDIQASKNDVFPFTKENVLAKIKSLTGEEEPPPYCSLQ